MVINYNFVKLVVKYKFSNSKEDIIINSFEKLFKAIKPDYRIITCATNDRTNYQADAFICFTGCVVFYGRIYYEFNDKLRINKIRIKHCF